MNCRITYGTPSSPVYCQHLTPVVICYRRCEERPDHLNHIGRPALITCTRYIMTLYQPLFGIPTHDPGPEESLQSLECPVLSSPTRSTELLNPNSRLDTLPPTDLSRNANALAPTLPSDNLVIYRYGDREVIFLRQTTYDVRLPCHNLPASSFRSRIVARSIHRPRLLQYIRIHYSWDCTPREHRIL